MAYMRGKFEHIMEVYANALPENVDSDIIKVR